MAGVGHIPNPTGFGLKSERNQAIWDYWNNGEVAILRIAREFSLSESVVRRILQRVQKHELHYSISNSNV